MPSIPVKNGRQEEVYYETTGNGTLEEPYRAVPELTLVTEAIDRLQERLPAPPSVVNYTHGPITSPQPTPALNGQGFTLLQFAVILSDGSANVELMPEASHDGTQNWVPLNEEPVIFDEDGNHSIGFDRRLPLNYVRLNWKSGSGTLHIITTLSR